MKDFAVFYRDMMTRKLSSQVVQAKTLATALQLAPKPQGSQFAGVLIGR